MALWTPADLAAGKLKMWLRANTLTGADGSAVATWPDASGVGNDASGQNSPTVVASGLNSMRTVLFNGSTQWFSVPTTLLSGRTASVGMASFAVVKAANFPPTAESRTGPIFGDFGTNGSLNHFPYTDGNVYEDYGCDTRRSAGAPDLASWRIARFRSKDGFQNIAVDGNSPFFVHGDGFAVSNTPKLGQAGGSVFYDGQMAEIVDCADYLTTAEVEQIEGYLAWKWGLQGNLPSGHTFKAAAPTNGAAGPTYTLTVTSAGVAVTGNGVSLKRARRLAVGMAAVTVAAQPVRLLRARKVGVAVAGVAVAAQQVSLRRSLRLAVAVQPVTVAASAVKLSWAHRLAVGTAPVTVAGQSVALRWSHRLVVQAAAVTITANLVTLTKGGAGQLVVATANVAVAASPVRMVVSRRLSVAVAPVSVTAAPVGLVRSLRLTIASASVAVAAQAVQLRRARTLAVEASAVTVASGQVGLRAFRRIAVAPGAIIITAQPVNLTKQGAITLVDSGLASRRFAGRVSRTFGGFNGGRTFR